MNMKITMILIIITIGMSFGCIENTSEVTIQEPTPVQIELIEIEYNENSTPTPNSVNVVESTPTLEPTPEPTIIDQEEIKNTILALHDEGNSMGEKQDEINSLIKSLEKELENNSRIVEEIEYVETHIEGKIEYLGVLEQRLETESTLNAEIEHEKDMLEVLQIRKQNLEEKSLSNEEITEINSEIEDLFAERQIYVDRAYEIRKEIAEWKELL